MGKAKYTVTTDITIRVAFDVTAESQFDAVKAVERLDVGSIFPQWRVVSFVIPQADGIDAEIIPENVFKGPNTKLLALKVSEELREGGEE